MTRISYEQGINLSRTGEPSGQGPIQKNKGPQYRLGRVGRSYNPRPHPPPLHTHSHTHNPNCRIMNTCLCTFQIECAPWTGFWWTLNHFFSLLRFLWIVYIFLRKKITTVTFLLFLVRFWFCLPCSPLYFQKKKAIGRTDGPTVQRSHKTSYSVAGPKLKIWL